MRRYMTVFYLDMYAYIHVSSAESELAKKQQPFYLFNSLLIMLELK